MVRKIAIITLLIVIIGASGAAYYLFRNRQVDDDCWKKVHLAEAMIEANDFQGAVTHLLPVVQLGKRFRAADAALFALARAYEGAGSTESHLIWKRLVVEFPRSQYHDEARLREAKSLLAKDPAAARDVFEKLAQNALADVRDAAFVGLAQTFEAENNVSEARSLYYKVLESATMETTIAQAKDRLTEINTQMLWSPILDDFCELYEIQRGDAPIKIAAKFKTTAWFILESNKLRGSLRPGSRIKVPKEPLRIVVDKSTCRLNLLTESGRFVKWYPVGIGEQSYKTPAGDYTIKTKEVDPTWFSPNEGVKKPGDPDNALGTRWMGIGSSLGIHGTNAPETIGFRKSAGCIRMYNHDVEELYKLVTYGTNVTITEKLIASSQ